MAFTPSRTSDDWRGKADEHDRKADQLVSGEAKDNHISAARACRDAATKIDKANRSTRKTQIFESAVISRGNAVELVESLKAEGFSAVEIQSLTKDAGAAHVNELRRQQLRTQGHNEADVERLVNDKKVWKD